MLEAVEKLVTENPKLLPGEYGDLVRALKKVCVPRSILSHMKFSIAAQRIHNVLVK